MSTPLARPPLGRLLTATVTALLTGVALAPPASAGSAYQAHGRHKSDPTHWDTDRGGISDGGEVRRRADPSDIRSGPRNPRVGRPTGATA